MKQPFFILLIATNFLLIDCWNFNYETCRLSPRKRGVCVPWKECPGALYGKMIHGIFPRMCRNNVQGQKVCCAMEQKSAQACARFREGKTPHDIINGAIVNVIYPHMASLYSLEQKRQFCGGALISEQYVLTAAHCLRRTKPENILIRMGKLNISGPIDENDFKAAEFLVHAEFNYMRVYNDIALIKLQNPVAFSTKVYPACLNTNSSIDSKLQIVGWGSLSEGGYGKSDILMEAAVTVHDKEACERFHPRSSQNPFGLKNMFCAGGQGTSDTCQGDSGGPLETLINEQNPIATIIGITSAGSSPCNNNPGIYTNVATYLPWIEERVWPSQKQ